MVVVSKGKLDISTTVAILLGTSKVVDKVEVDVVVEVVVVVGVSVVVVVIVVLVVVKVLVMGLVFILELEWVLGFVLEAILLVLVIKNVGFCFGNVTVVLVDVFVLRFIVCLSTISFVDILFWVVLDKDA